MMQKNKILNPILIRRTVMISLIITVIGMVILWFTFQHIPNWYHPIRLDDAGKKRARKETANLFDTIGDKLVRGESFEMRLTQRRVNEWLSLLPDFLAVGGSSESPRITEPAVCFEKGLTRIGAHYQNGGLRVILSVTLTASIISEGREMELTIFGIHGGSLPAPKSIMEPLINQLLKKIRSRMAHDSQEGSIISSVLAKIESSDDLFAGIKSKNRYVWPNGERLFKIDFITMGDGEIHFRIIPI